MRLHLLILAALLSLAAAIPDETGASKKRRLKHRPARGWKNRRLHYSDTHKSKSDEDAGRAVSGSGKGGKGGNSGGDYYDTVGDPGRTTNTGYTYGTATPSNGAANAATNGATNVGTNTATNGGTNAATNGQGPSSPGSSIYNSASYNTEGYVAPEYTTTTSALTTYDNKCDAAEVGAEFRSNTYVPIYYQYEVVTSTNRNILQIADIIDKACQHFLAIWMVDCVENLGGSNGARQRALLHMQQREMQMTLAPIVGTGVGSRDTVLLGGNSASQCTNLVGSADMGQTCYKVIGSLLVYLDETMQVVASDVQTLAHDTLSIGMNYGTTDFTLLDPDIYALQFIQGYGSAPQDLINSNSEANLRPWDPNNNNNSQPSEPSKTSLDEQAALVETGRSGGAKFGIAFATLLCIAILAFVTVFIYKNRYQLSPKKKVRKQRKHYNLDDMTQATTNFEPKERTRTVSPVEDEPSFSNADVKLTVLRLAESRSPESVATGPLSPEPETPRYTYAKKCGSVNESNIITPRSDYDCSRSTISARSGLSDMTEPASGWSASTPDDRLGIKPSRPVIRKFPLQKQAPKASELASPDRSYQVEDTVQL